MAYKFYKSLLSISTSPSQQYQDDLQAVRNEQFDNASSWCTIQEEISFGSGTWKNVDVRLCKVSQARAGSKLSDDDFQQIFFKDLNHLYSVGSLYKISGDYWLSVIDKDIIRKCNNTLKWINNSTLYEYPCVVGDIFNSLLLDKSKSIDLQRGQIIVTTQHNSDTSRIDVGDRFILNGQAYKVVDYSSLANRYVLNLIMAIDQKQVDDDTTNSVADTSTDDYDDIIDETSGNVLSPLVEGIKLGKTVKFAIYKYVNGEANEDTFAITTTGVPPSHYTLTAINDDLITACNEFTIKNEEAYYDGQLQIICVNNISHETVTHYLSLQGWW